MVTVNEASTKELSDEISKRGGVRQLYAEPHEDVRITVGLRELVLTGPAIILVNQD